MDTIVQIELILKEAPTSLNHNLSQDITNNLDVIMSVCESRKAILTVLITLLLYKHLNPIQDIRSHQAGLPNGFSGRTFDTKIVTPFMKKHKFPFIKESGWLTRSFEQNAPFDLNYPGKISPKKAKDAFLFIIDKVQNNECTAKDCLLYLFKKLIEYKELHKVEIDINQLNDKTISINEIITLIKTHFLECKQVGKARLPVLAMYSIYEVIIKELHRYKGKTLKLLESHTSADSRSGSIGDIDILNSKGKPFEGIEIKYDKPITAQMVLDAYEKFKNYRINRYYLLSTAKTSDQEKKIINSAINQISQEHGCQVIVNGLIPTLKYYLRLVSDTHAFR